METLVMQIHYRCFVTVSPVVSNDNALALTRSIEALLLMSAVEEKEIQGCPKNVG